MNYSIYKHTNLINGKSYIGITSQKCQNRWGIEGCGYKFQPKFYSAIQKYGWDNFKHEILYFNLSKEEALRIESDLIDKYNTIENGYNVVLFGSIESKKIICLNNNKIFDSISEAAIYGNVSDASLSHYLAGKQDTCGEKDGVRLTWEYLDYPNKNQEAKQVREQRKQHREQKFYTAETLEIVNKYQQGISLNQLSKEYNKTKDGIKSLLKFYDISIISSLDRSCKGVVQLDNNKKIINKFNSMADALRAINKNPNNTYRLKRACEETWRKVGGYYWRWAIDFKEDSVMEF